MDEFPVDGPPFARAQHTAEWAALAEPAPLAIGPQQNRANLSPWLLQNPCPFGRGRRRRDLEPPRARPTGRLEPCSLRVAINPTHDDLRQPQAALVDLFVRTHAM
jgi:hypothetical protein